MEVSWHTKVRGTIAKKRMVEDRRGMPKEEGDSIREYKAMHEENFPSSWMMEDVESKAEEMEKVSGKPKQKGAKVGNRE